MSTTITLTGNTFRSNGTGINISGQSALNVTNNIFSNNTGYAGLINAPGTGSVTFSGNSGTGNLPNGLALYGTFGSADFIRVLFPAARMIAIEPDMTECS